MKKNISIIKFVLILACFFVSCSSNSGTSQTSSSVPIITNPTIIYDFDSKIHYSLFFDQNEETIFEIPIYSNNKITTEDIKKFECISSGGIISYEITDVSSVGISAADGVNQSDYVLNLFKIKVKLNEVINDREIVDISSLLFDIDENSISLNTDISIVLISNLITPSMAFDVSESIDLYWNNQGNKVMIVGGDMVDDFQINGYNTFSKFVSIQQSEWRDSNKLIRVVTSPDSYLKISSVEYKKDIFADFYFAVKEIESPWYIDTMLMSVQYCDTNGKIIEGNIAYKLNIFYDWDEYHSKIYETIKDLGNE